MKLKFQKFELEALKKLRKKIALKAYLSTSKSIENIRSTLQQVYM